MTPPAIPSAASTVVLVRPAATGGFEILMHRRPDKMDTYAGAYVFPGGRVEADDWSPDMLRFVHGLTPADAQQILSSALEPERCLGHWVAAVRELFEEAGIGLFEPLGMSNGAVRRELSERLSSRRASLQLGKIGLPRLLESEGAICDLRRLTYFFHRVTPEHYPVRFDTRFYIAALPTDQIPLQVSEEVSESLWITPQEALDRHGAGSFPMMPPTLAVLDKLAAHSGWAALEAVYSSLVK